MSENSFEKLTASPKAEDAVVELNEKELDEASGGNTVTIPNKPGQKFPDPLTPIINSGGLKTPPKGGR